MTYSYSVIASDTDVTQDTKSLTGFAVTDLNVILGKTITKILVEHAADTCIHLEFSDGTGFFIAYYQTEGEMGFLTKEKLLAYKTETNKT
jgi:hypothetical protein